MQRRVELYARPSISTRSKDVDSWAPDRETSVQAHHRDEWARLSFGALLVRVATGLRMGATRR